MRPSALNIARHGIAILSFDFRGHGKSNGLFEGNEARDVIAALECLLHHPEIDPRRIALVGHSLGAIAAIRAAAEAEYLRASVFISLPVGTNERTDRFLSSIHHKAAQVGGYILEYPRHGPLPGTRVVEGMICVLWMRLRGYRLHVDWGKSLELWNRLGPIIDIDMERLGAFPKLFVHCKGDRIAPYESVLELYRRAAPPKELFGAERGFHNTPLLPGRLRKKWIAWLVSVLS
jgi:pimeloyl-ACP methyl ester carboxylesterase